MPYWPNFRRKPVLFTTAAVVLLAVVLHVPLLRLAAGLLIAEDAPTTPRTMLIAGGDRCFDVASELYTGGEVQSVLLCQSLPERLELIGIRRSGAEIARDELIARNVSPESITLLQITPDAGLDPVERLDQWLAEHPEDQVVILCSRFSSRLWRLRLDHGLSEPNRVRTGLRALPDRRFDETNWWRSKDGIKAWFGSAFEQLYFRSGWAEPEQLIDYDPDLYEQTVFGK